MWGGGEWWLPKQSVSPNHILKPWVSLIEDPWKLERERKAYHHTIVKMSDILLSYFPPISMLCQLLPWLQIKPALRTLPGLYCDNRLLTGQCESGHGLRPLVIAFAITAIFLDNP